MTHIMCVDRCCDFQSCRRIIDMFIGVVSERVKNQPSLGKPLTDLFSSSMEMGYEKGRRSVEMVPFKVI